MSDGNKLGAGRIDRNVSGPDKDWLTAVEAALWLGIHSTKTFKKLIEDGKFPRGVEMSDGVQVWPWMDVVAYGHLRSRL